MVSWSNVKHKFPFVFVVAFIVIAVLYYFAYYFPFTDNAFAVTNVRPVAANVEGYITDIYVRNEEYVKKGHPLFKVFQKPYELAYAKAEADVASAKSHLISLGKEVEKIQSQIVSEQSVYERLTLDHQHYAQALQDHAVPEVAVMDLLEDKNAAGATLMALQKDLERAEQDLHTQEMQIKSFEAVMANAKVDLDETIVYAKNDGIVQNMFVALGSPVEMRQPLFSFEDTDNVFIQGNFNETDLRKVRPGDSVTILPRMYLWQKVYHGVIVSKNWAASRQITNGRSQEQIVTNSENNWFLLPQRFPVQIRITDYDAESYPLSVGASAYVYIHTN